MENINKKLDRIEVKLDLLLKRGKAMNETTQAVLDAVTKETTLEQSAIALIGNLQTQLTNALANTTINPTDQQNLNTIFADLQANATALSAALTANTPVAPAGDQTQQ